MKTLSRNEEIPAEGFPVAAGAAATAGAGGVLFAVEGAGVGVTKVEVG